MRFRDYFRNDFETSENHHIQSLRSRYYRCRNEQGMDAVKKLAEEEKGTIKYVDETRHEIIYDTKTYSVTATITSPSFSETAIDFKIITYKLIPMGSGKKIIEDLYKKLDNLLPFKGVSLYRGR